MRALVLLLALSTTASADGFYFGEAIGGADVKNQLGAYVPEALRFKFVGGYRQGNWAFEGHIGAFLGFMTGPAAHEDDGIDRPHHFDPFSSMFVWGFDVKYIERLGGPFETYLRGGLSYGMLDDGTRLHQYAGRGAGVGAGVQLKGKVRALGFLAWPFFFLKIGPKVTAALWVDAGYEFYRLHPHGVLHRTPSVDAELTSITGGFAVGSDF